MTMKDFYTTLTQSFLELLDRRAIHEKTVAVRMENDDIAVSADRTIRAPEVKLIARYEGVGGECYTCFPGEFTGTLAQVAALELENDPVSRSIYIAAMNAVMNKYERADECLVCDEGDGKRCAEQIANQYMKNNGRVNVLLVGYQPYMMEALAARFPLRVLDLDPDTIGASFFGVRVEDGLEAYADATRWAEVILCSGSSLANGTFFDYAKLPKDVLFYGTTIAGAARALGLRRVCPFGKNS